MRSSISQFIDQLGDLWNDFWIFTLIIVLVWIALKNEAGRDKGIQTFLKNTSADWKEFGLWAFVQRILDYLANKLIIRQFLNPYFFFPFSVLLTIWLWTSSFVREGADLILFITFLALMWYARETHALREEAKKQTKILTGRPLVVLNKEVKEIEEKYSIYNAGNAVAIDISIKYFKGEKEIFSNQPEQKFVALGAKDIIAFNVTRELGELADAVDPHFRVRIEYFNLNDIAKKDRLCTVLAPDEKILTRSNVGRFKILDYA